MIGNDIVDLKLVLLEDKASNLRWLKKVFVEKEIELIQNSESPNITLWRLWSMKESAYKVAVKKTGIRAFNPKRFETEILGPCQGRVSSIYGIFQTNSHSKQKHTLFTMFMGFLKKKQVILILLI